MPRRYDVLLFPEAARADLEHWKSHTDAGREVYAWTQGPRGGSRRLTRLRVYFLKEPDCWGYIAHVEVDYGPRSRGFVEAEIRTMPDVYLQPSAWAPTTPDAG